MSRKRRIKRSKINFEVTPLQGVLDQFEINKNPNYAQALNLDLTKLFYDTLRFKCKHNENINIEVMGTTRSGKSTVAAVIEQFVAKIRKTTFTVENFRRDQYDFLDYIKDIKKEDLLKSQWVVDESREAIYQAGSVAQRSQLQDFNNICAIYELSIAWLNPNKFSQAHNSQYALHVWGRDFKNKLTRCLLYDIHSQDSFAATPLGYVIIDVSSFIGSDLEKEYLDLKWVRVDQQREQSISSSSDAKREMAEAIVKIPQWDSMKNKKQKKLFVQTVVGEGVPIQVVDEITELCEILEFLPSNEELKDEFKKHRYKKK